MSKNLLYILSLLLFVSLFSCEEAYTPTPYNFEKPEGFTNMPVPVDNPLTVEGVALGKKLFYDQRLSKNNIQSCATCHDQAFGFSDHGSTFSTGVEGNVGSRNAMALINLGWSQKFFWDGRASSLEELIFEPVRNPIEMNTTWDEVEQKLNSDQEYTILFKQAFNIDYIDSVHVSKAIAQFLRTIVSGNSKFDKFRRGEVNLTPSELSGYDIFRTERGDCFHCHTLGDNLFTDNTFKNNGLDSDADMDDPGLMGVTGFEYDKGKFKVPTLRNIELTAPYMHDGRFATLEEVVNHYDMGGTPSSTIDPLMKKVGIGLNLTLQERTDLVNFLKTLTDESFITNPEFAE